MLYVANVVVEPVNQTSDRTHFKFTIKNLTWLSLISHWQWLNTRRQGHKLKVRMLMHKNLQNCHNYCIENKELSLLLFNQWSWTNDLVFKMFVIIVDLHNYMILVKLFRGIKSRQCLHVWSCEHISTLLFI